MHHLYKCNPKWKFLCNLTPEGGCIGRIKLICGRFAKCEEYTYSEITEMWEDDDYYECPNCTAIIKKNSDKCDHCGEYIY